MTRTVILGSALLLALGTLGGCGEFSRALGLEKSPPDEFTVVAGAPLALPPDFGLRPPRSASDKPSTETTTDKARQTVFRMADAPKPTTVATAAATASAGEQALLGKAGALDADASVRAKVDQEAKHAGERDKGFINDLMFWQAAPVIDETVDSSKEAQRLSENAALNKPVTAGVTPQIERTKRTILEDIF
jgi:hypothetical protein